MDGSWDKCTFKQYCLFYVTKKHLGATQACFYYIWKCAKSALKQSDSVMNSTVQGTERGRRKKRGGVTQRHL